MEKELLKDTDLSLDGNAFVKATGFKYVYSDFVEGAYGVKVDSIHQIFASTIDESGG